MPELWAAGSLKSTAARLPGTQIQRDVDNRLARVFGAYTSGQVMLYDTNGRLQMPGGITPSRGHVGSMPGRATLISSILSDDNVNPLAPVMTPVFGSGLHDRKGDDRLETSSRVQCCSMPV